MLNLFHETESLGMEEVLSSAESSLRTATGKTVPISLLAQGSEVPELWGSG